MSTFAELFEKSIRQVAPGDIIKGTVINVDNDYVTVDAGLKSEALISSREFENKDGEIAIAVGEEVDVALIAFEDGYGETVLSREKARWIESWATLNKAHEAGETVIGVISSKVKGGFTVELDGVRAFLPGSLVDVRPVRDSSYLEGKELEFKIIKMDVKRSNVVVSRRAVVEEASSSERDLLLQNLQEGMEVKGIIKNITDYGAFVDLGGVDGLLHITDMSWKRVKHPSEILNVGDEMVVKVLKFDRERNRVSLGMKQLGDDPWADLAARYPIGKRLSGKVTNLTDYGCFVELEEGVEGLVHMSEMDWTNKNINPGKLVKLGQEVDVMVLEIDESRRRISLGMKQCVDNPWDAFSQEHKKGETIKGQIRSITDFGIFIGLTGEIDGLVHLSDISWDKPGEEAVRDYKKGDEVEAVIIAIDPERERISLGIKQLHSDPFGEYTEQNGKGALVTGKVIAVDNKVATIELAEGVEGQLKAAEYSLDKADNLSEHLHEGDEIEAVIIRADRKNRQLQLSIRAKDTAVATGEAEASSATLGDLLKEKMNLSDKSSDE